MSSALITPVLSTSVPIPTDTTQWKELAIREGDGLTVSLLWNPATDAVKVTVADSRLEHAFELHVDGADALSAYYHPFALAAAQDIVLGAFDRASLDLQPQV